MLNTDDVSMPELPQPELPEAPVQVADPPAELEAGPSQPRSKKRQVYNNDQLVALKAFFAINAHPTPEQREEMGKKIGLTANKIYHWIKRYQTQTNIQSEEQRYADLNRMYGELMKKNEELQLQNQFLIDALNTGTCSQCRGPVLHADVLRLGSDVVPPQPEILLSNVDGPIDKDLMRTDVRNLLSTSTKRRFSQMPSEILPLPAHDLVGVDTKLIAGIIAKAQDEFLKLAITGAPLWVNSHPHISAFQPETLQLREYFQSFPCQREPAPYFRSEASRYTAEIPIRPTTLVKILMDVEKWQAVFCSMVTNARTLEVLLSGIQEEYKEHLQVMSAEYMVTSNLIYTREVQFVRYSHQQLDGSWAIIDVSMDELRTQPRPQLRATCKKRPSGCLIRDLQNGSSYITWVEHVDVHDNNKETSFKQFSESGFPFGAKRWISVLQRQSTRFLCANGINTAPSDTVISLRGRRSLAALSNRMVISFCTDVSNSTLHCWTDSNNARNTNIKVKTNKRRGDPGKPRGVIRTAATTNIHPVPHTRLFDFLRGAQNRQVWDSMSMGSPVHEIVNFITGLDPCNCISVLAIQNQNDFLILQECFTDSTGSYLIYAAIDKATFQSMLSGGDPKPIPMLPYGFSILPDVTTARFGGDITGTLMTIVFQISVESIEGRSKAAVEIVANLLKDMVTRIKTAVN